MNRRITKPPGGDASDIFGSTSPSTTPPTTPRKVKNYLASNIFSAEKGDGLHKTRQRPDDDSFKRLFGAGGNNVVDGGSPIRIKNHQKSNILLNDGQTNGKAHTNGHTNGTNGHSSPTNGHDTNGHNGSDSGLGSGGSVTPNETEHKTNGHNGINGHNGHANGNGNGHIEHMTPTRRIPPGGFSNIGNIFSP